MSINTNKVIMENIVKQLEFELKYTSYDKEQIKKAIEILKEVIK